MSGTIDGRTFDTVGASYVIGHPDDPDRTVVILVFDRPIACSEVTQAGWDARVADGSQVLELKLIGKSAGEYPVATGGQPTAGESDVNYTLTSTSSTPAEVSATEGTVTLEVNGTASASGTFDLSFPGGAAAGSFAAAGCSGGREP